MKIDIVNVCDSNYFTGLITLLHSLDKHNPWYKDHRFVIIDAGLNEKQKKFLGDRGIIVKTLSDERKNYYGEFVHEKIKGRLGKSFFKFEGLKTEADGVLFLDNDIITIGDISPIINTNHNIAITEFSNNSKWDECLVNKLVPPDKPKPPWCAGMIFFKGDMEYYYEKCSKFFNIRSHKSADQIVFNEAVKDEEVYYIDWKYQGNKRFFSDRRDGLKNVKEWDMRSIHYIGKKPWLENGTDGDQQKLYYNVRERRRKDIKWASFKELNSLWYSYFMEIENKKEKGVKETHIEYVNKQIITYDNFPVVL
jgi:lipopolysaccharide biosynthesis glycosyltransferase